MHFVFWITKATDTHLEYVILIAFPWQQWFCKCASLLCVYICCLPCFYYFLLFLICHYCTLKYFRLITLFHDLHNLLFIFSVSYVAYFQQLRNYQNWHSKSTHTVKGLLNFVCMVLLFSFHMIMLAAYPIMFYSPLSSPSVFTNFSSVTMLKEHRGWDA